MVSILHNFENKKRRLVAVNKENKCMRTKIEVVVFTEGYFELMCEDRNGD